MRIYILVLLILCALQAQGQVDTSEYYYIHYPNGTKITMHGVPTAWGNQVIRNQKIFYKPPQLLMNNRICGSTELEVVVSPEISIKVLNSSNAAIDTGAVRAIRYLLSRRATIDTSQFRVKVNFSYENIDHNNSNAYDECKHTFLTNRCMLYTKFPAYLGDFEDIASEHAGIRYYWLIVYRDGSVTRPTLLCNPSIGEPKGLEDEFLQKMQSINGGKPWTPAEINGEKVDCPMIIAL